MRSSWFMRKVRIRGEMEEGGREHLDIHEVIHTDAPKLGELLSALLQELCNRVTLLTLSTVRIRI